MDKLKFLLTGKKLIFSILVLVSVAFVNRYVLADSLPIQPASIKLHKQTALPDNAQKEIEKLAVQYLKKGYDPKVIDLDVEVDPEDVGVIHSKILPDHPLYPFKKLDRTLKEFFTFDPAAKAYVVLRHSQWELLEAIRLLEQATREKDPAVKSGKVELAAQMVENSKREFSKISKLSDSIRYTDPVKANLTDNVAGRFAAEWLSYQLILEKVQDSLDDKSFLRIEQARQTELSSFARILLKSTEGNSQALALELSYEVQSQSGNEPSLIKTIEILQELEDVSSVEDKKPLQSAQFMLARTFEDKLKGLPKDEGSALIHSIISNIKGNPLKQFRGYDRMRRYFKAQNTVLLAEILKSEAIVDLEQKIMGLTDEPSYKLFIQTGLKNGADDLRVLAALDFKLALDPKADPSLKDRVAIIHSLIDQIIVERLKEDPNRLKESPFAKRVVKSADLLDVRVINIIAAAIAQDSSLDPSLKQEVNVLARELLKQMAQRYQSFPVPKTSSPLASKALTNLLNNTTLSQQTLLKTAVEAESDVLRHPLSTATTEPSLVDVQKVINNIEQKPVVVETFTPVKADAGLEKFDKTIEVVDSSTQKDAVLLKTEQLVEEIFSAPAGKVTPVEAQLPKGVQKEIEQLKKTTTEIPVVTTPAPSITVTPTTVPTQSPGPTSEPTALPQPTQPTQVTQPTVIEAPKLDNGTDGGIKSN